MIMRMVDFRVLMQRGLRTNPKSVALWVGYAQLEWHYATKLRLGIYSEVSYGIVFIYLCINLKRTT